MVDNDEILKCPACQGEMEKIYIEDKKIHVDICLNGCGGIFFDNNEFKRFDEKQESIKEIAALIKDKDYTKTNESFQRICPLCGATMVKNYASIKKEIEIDECYNCGGKFLDHDELEKIRAQYDTEQERVEDVLNSEEINAYKKEIERAKIESDFAQSKRSTFKTAFDKVYDKLRPR